LPPCPASTTTVLKLLLVFLTAVVVTVPQPANEAKKATVTRRVIWRGILIYSKKYVFYQKFFA
jgi:hypothetical protein